MLNDEELRELLPQVIHEHTQRSKRNRKLYECPFCGSGTGKNGTGALGMYRRNGALKWKCQVCGRGGDIGDFIAEIEHIDKDAGIKRARELYGNREPIKDTVFKDIDDSKPKKLPATVPAERSDRIMDYLHSRGFSDETIKDFELSYFFDSYGDLRLAIPTNKNHFVGRRLVDKNDGNDKMNWGKVSLFNSDDLYNTENRPVFVCEGWADALSVYECGGYAIATNSISQTRRLVIEALQERPTESPLIIAYDNDRDGNNYAEKLAAELQTMGYNSLRFAPDQYKDLNEWYVKDRNNFLTAIQEAEKEAEAMQPRTEQQPVINQEATTQEAANSYADNYLINHIDGIMEDTKSQKFKAVSTGFLQVDEMLNGGLFAGLTVLGAESSMGKSTLIMNIGENLAESGHDVLYFSLEMSVSQLVMRGLSKQSFLMNDKKKGYESARIKNNQAGDLSKIIEAYKNKIAGRMIIIPNKTGGITVEDICRMTENHIKTTGNQPIVVIDYLQYIADLQRQDKQKIDHAVQELKTISLKYNLIVIAISSINRASYGKELEMESFKDSGNIEYTADLLLGLYFSKCNAKNGAKLTPKEFEEERKKKPREMTLKVIKGRDIEAGIKRELRYYSQYNYFEDIKNLWKEYKPIFTDQERKTKQKKLIPRDNAK